MSHKTELLRGLWVPFRMRSLAKGFQKKSLPQDNKIGHRLGFRV